MKRPANHSAGRIAYLGVFTALAMVLGYVEMLVPISLTVPGIKLGLSNIVVLITLYVLGKRSAALVVCIKVFAISLLFGNFAILPFSLAGGIMSLGAMIVAARLIRLPLISVSMIGGVAHNVGQIVVVSFVYTAALGISLLWILMLAGIIAGLLIGVGARIVLHTMRGTSLVRSAPMDAS